MSLVEKWRNNVGDGAPITERDEAFCDCAEDLEAACTPRPPQVKWFGAPVDADGKPTGKWDRWMFQHRDGSWFLVRGAWIERGMIFTPGGSDPIESIVACVPVRREGPPAMDVGWDVVGG